MRAEDKPLSVPPLLPSYTHAREEPGRRRLKLVPRLPESRPASAHPNPLRARQPLFWAALAYAGGLWIGRDAWRPPSWWLAGALVFACASVYFLRRRPGFSRLLACGAFVFSGSLAFQTCSPNIHSAEIWPADGSETEVIAHVVSEGNVQADGPGSLHQRVDLESEQLGSGSIAQKALIGIRLNIYSKQSTRYDLAEEGAAEAGVAAGAEPAMELLRYGQRIRFSATLNRPRNFRNPGAFDYTGYLREEGIAATASAKDSEIEKLPGFRGTRAGLYLARIRHSILQQVHKVWPEEAAGLIDAMLTGEKSFVERPTRVDFQRSGTYHLLVVAGLHVGVLAAFVLWILRLFRPGEVFASAAAMATIFVYAAVTKEGAPVWRAALMFAVYLATRLLYRRRALLNALGAAALALMLVSPNALFGASLQMTLLCVGVIVGIAVPVLERTTEPYARGLRNLDVLTYDRSLPPGVAQFRIDLRMVLARLGRFSRSRLPRFLLIYGLRGLFAVLGYVVISGTMQLGMTLPMAVYFHRATTVALPANLLVVPFLQLLMPAAVLAVVSSYISLWLAKIPAAVAGFALSGITGTVHWLGGLRIADLRVVTPAPAVVVVAGFSILLATILIRKRSRILASAGFALVAASAMLIWKVSPTPKLRPGNLEVTAIDVGQGDSILVLLPDQRGLLLDGGGLPGWTRSQMDIGEDVVSPYLWWRGLSRLDAIALTHAHADHMAGLHAIMANFHPRELWLPEGIRQEEIAGLLRSAAQFGVRVAYRKAGDSFNYGGAMVRVLAPNPDFPVRVAHRNHESLVMKFTYRNTSALLEADAEKGTERLVSSEKPAADVLKVAHHGSASGTNYDLLAAVKPRFAVISVGSRNVYHHPRYPVLQRLQEAGAITYRTDVDGATSFFLDGKSVTVELSGLR